MDITVNYLAVLACGIVAIILGFIWYGPLFGKPWMKMMGIDMSSPEKMAEGKKKMPMMAVIQFVGALIMAFVLARAIAIGTSAEGISGLAAAFHFAFWNWLGFVAPVTVGMVLWEGKSWKLWAIVAGYWLVNMLVMGAILAVWM